MEPQKPGNSPGSGPEVVERQRVAKKFVVPILVVSLFENFCLFKCITDLFSVIG